MRQDRFAFLIVLWIALGCSLIIVPLLGSGRGLGGLRELAFTEPDITTAGILSSEPWSLRSSGALDGGDRPSDPDPAGLTASGSRDGDPVILREVTTTVSTESPAHDEAVGWMDRAPSPEAAPTTTTVQAEEPWVRLYRNDFAGGSLDHENWVIQNGPGWAGWGLRRPSAVDVVPQTEAEGGHVLQVTASTGSSSTGSTLGGGSDGADAGSQTGTEAPSTADRSEVDELTVSGGLRLQDRGMTFGRYRIRLRVDGDAAQVTAPIIGLRPDSGRHRDGGLTIVDGRSQRAQRMPVRSGLYWTDADGEPGGVRVDHDVAATQWHTYTLVWRPDGITVAVDDGTPQILSIGTDHLSDSPMSLVIRLDAVDAPDAPGRHPVLSEPVRLQIDWIDIDAFNGPGTGTDSQVGPRSAEATSN